MKKAADSSARNSENTGENYEIASQARNDATEPIPGAYVFSNRDHPVEGVLSIQYRLNELVMTPAGPARIVGVFHDKENGRTQAIVALEGQPFEGFNHTSRLAYVEWDQTKRKEPELELRLFKSNEAVTDNYKGGM